MCQHNKRAYERYGMAQQVCEQTTKSERRSGQSGNRPLQPYHCSGCRMWFVHRPVWRRKDACPYRRGRERSSARRLIQEYV